MKILSKQDASELLSRTSPDVFVAKLLTQLQLVEGTYSAPLNSGVQIALSKLFAYLMLRSAPICMNITGWGIATEQFDLFDGYRRSLGEMRSLIEAPLHFFERTDEEAFISLLSMVFFFSWDASVFDLTGKLLLQTSHDGWLEIRTSEGALIEDLTTNWRPTESLSSPALRSGVIGPTKDCKCSSVSKGVDEVCRKRHNGGRQVAHITILIPASGRIKPSVPYMCPRTLRAYVGGHDQGSRTSGAKE